MLTIFYLTMYRAASPVYRKLGMGGVRTVIMNGQHSYEANSTTKVPYHESPLDLID
jgi:hypothetical protein